VPSAGSGGYRCKRARPSRFRQFTHHFSLSWLLIPQLHNSSTSYTWICNPPKRGMIALTRPSYLRKFLPDFPLEGLQRALLHRVLGPRNSWPGDRPSGQGICSLSCGSSFCPPSPSLQISLVSFVCLSFHPFFNCIYHHNVARLSACGLAG
jgi:hypothetical protein